MSLPRRLRKACKNGHLYEEGSYRLDCKGWRNCLTCLRENWARVRERHPKRYLKYYNKEKHRLEAAQSRINNPESYIKSEEKRKKTDKYLLGGYRAGSKKRNLIISLSDSDMLKLLHDECFYCGKVDCRGIDRIDNNVGYEDKNCVPCCRACNWAKSQMSQEDFYALIKRIAIRRLGAKFDS